MKIRALVPLALFVVAVAFYLPTLFGYGTIGFDDNLIFNRQLDFWRAPIEWQTIFTTDTYINNGTSATYYRPINSLSYYIEPHLLGSTNYWAYHLTNTLAFAVIVVLMWWLLRGLGGSVVAATAATLLFIVLPWFAPTVVWIAARDYLWMTIFALAAWLFFIRYCRSRRWITILPVVVCYALAIGSKESTVAIIALAGLYLLMVDRQWRKYWVRDAVLIGLLVLVTLGYLWVRATVLPEAKLTIFASDDGVYTPLLADFIAQSGRNILALFDGLSQLVVPFDHALLVQITPLKVALGLAVTAMLILYAVRYKGRPAGQRWFYVLWYFVALAPLLLVSMNFCDFTSHRYLFPSIGLFVILSDLIGWALAQRPKVGYIAIGVVVAACVVVNMNKREVYRNQISFGEFHVERQPASILCVKLLCNAYVRDGKLDKAWTVVETPEMKACNKWDIINLRAEILAKSGQVEQAESELRRIPQQEVNKYWMLSKNWGIIRLLQGRHEEALDCFERAIEIFLIDNPNPHPNAPARIELKQLQILSKKCGRETNGSAAK